jgi:hypothetical protein
MTITLAFTKGGGKIDPLVITRADGGEERIDCPKQGIIPHDMVHYAVESTLSARGFLGRVAAGEVAAFTMGAESESDGVERLVEVIQGDAWSGGTSAPAEMIDLYRVTCEARDCPMLAIDAAAIDAIRAELGRLTEAWSATPVGGTLTLRFG